MADERRSDEEVLADLERSLTEQDGHITHRHDPPSHDGSQRTRVLTLAWLVWTATWFITNMLTSNPASLVLAVTSTVTYPAYFAVRRWWNRHRWIGRP